MPSWNAYGVERRTISPRFGVPSSAVSPSRSSTCARCDVGTCVASLVGVRLRATERVLLVLERQAVEVVEVVHPALGDAERAAGARLAVGHDRPVVLVLGLRVAGAVDEAGEVEAVAVDERRRLAGDGHVARDRVAELELGLPAEVLVVGVDPEQQLLLRALGDLAVGRLVAGVRLEVVGDVVGEVGEQRRAEQEAHVDRRGHADLAHRRRATSRDRLLDHAEVGAVGAAEVRVPLVLARGW